jgi:hypothetical protein
LEQILIILYCITQEEFYLKMITMQLNTSRCKLRRLDWLYSLCSNKTYITIIRYSYQSSSTLL